MGVSLCRTAVLVSVIIFVFASIAMAQPSEEDVAAAGLLREAEYLLVEGVVPLALEKLDRLLTEYPTSSSVPLARFRKVVAYLSLGRNQESISLARQLVQEYKGTENEILAAWAQCHIGINYMRLDDWEKALAELKKVKSDFGGIADKGPEIAAQAQLGEIYMMWHPPHASGLTGIAILRSYRGNLKGALAAYQELLKRYPDRKRKIAMAACEIACDWLARPPSDSAEAAQACELALVPRTIAPEETYYWAKAESALANYYLHKAKDPQKALAIYESLDSKMPTPGMALEVLHGLAASQRWVGDTAGALAAYQRLADEWKLTRSGTPACYAATNDPDMALQEYQWLVSSLPSGDRRTAVAATDLVLGMIGARDRKRTEANVAAYAEGIIEQVEASFPSEKWLLSLAKCRLAMCLWDHNGDLAGCESYLRECVEDAKDTDLLPMVLARLAQVQHMRGQFEESAATAQKVVDNYTYSTTLRHTGWSDFAAFICAESLYKAGKIEQSLAALDRLLALYPNSDWAKLARITREAWSQ